MRALLRLTLTPGLGPILIERLLQAFGNAERVLGASASALEGIKGIGAGMSAKIVRGMKESEALVDEELARLDTLGARVLVRGEAGYPALLTPIPSAPPLLMIRGSLEPEGLDRYPVALVGSRRCTAYGIEQAERFAGAFATSGLTVVSGGARGIDTAAHRGALRAGGRTIVVLGCGLGRAYPPENEELFERIVAEDRGAIVSELPAMTPPSAENFPARNRILSGLSLGVLVIEAGARSGALITARQALEDQGREVFALPGRADSEASRGSLALLKSGEAAVATEPGDVIGPLEAAARHHFEGTHAARYVEPLGATTSSMLERGDDQGAPRAPAEEIPAASEEQRRLLAALDGEMTTDELTRASGLEAGAVRAELTRLELAGRVRRRGSRVSRA
ncbi:MAG: DNA-processing protein DprA [Phycisphaerales bacterium]